MKRYISVSQANTFQTCSYKFHLEYNIGLRKKQELTPMALGLVVHAGIEAGLREYWVWQVREYVGNDSARIRTVVWNALQSWSDKNRPDAPTIPSLIVGDNGVEAADIPDSGFYRDWDKMVETAYQIVIRLFEYLDIPNNWEIQSVRTDQYENISEPLIEGWLEAPIAGTDFWVRGKVDAVLRNKHTGLIEVIDWKTRDRFTRDDDEKLSMQLGIYQHMLRELYGIDAMVGTVYQISSTLPSQPSLNKNGTMSRRKISTDWHTYEAALLEAGLDPRDYQDMQVELSGFETFRPLQVVRNERITTRLWDNLKNHAVRIAVAEVTPYSKADATYPKAYGYPCRNCVFAPICIADLHGWDVDAIIEEEYETREERSEATT